MTTQSKIEQAISLIDEAHAQDPNKIPIQGEEVPYELHYAQRMTRYLEARCGQPSDELRLAIRAQHFRRWEVPRQTYPMTRPGYFAWRTFLKKRQAEMAEQICLDVGYPEAAATRVASLIRKENFKQDEESQIVEDVACLVFLEKVHDEEKIVAILKKTWRKMSEKGHEPALKINMSDRAQSLVAKALSA